MQFTIRTLIVTTTATLALAFTSTIAAAEDVVSIDFKGGSALEYIEALAANADANIVVEDGAEHISVPALELKNASLRSALSLLEGRRYEDPNQRLELDLHYFGHGEGADPVYLVRVNTQSTNRNVQFPANSAVFSFTDLVEAGYSAADILSAIEQGQKLVEDGSQPPRLLFHEDTQLLMVRAHPEQMFMVRSVLETLHAAAEGKRSVEAAEREMQQIVQQAETEVREVQRAMRHEIDMRERDMEEIRRRAEEEMRGLMDQVRRLELQNEELRLELNRLKQRQGTEDATPDA